MAIINMEKEQIVLGKKNLKIICMNGGVIDTSSGILGMMGSAVLLFCSDFTLGISAIAGAYGLKKSLRGVLA